MATTTTVAGRIELDGSSIGNVRKQLKEATAELIKMQEQFGDTSQEAIRAAKRVAELKDRIQDAREQADLFDPGKKFQAFTVAASQIAAGFGAVQGAMALIGVESAEVEKTLLKVQAAMALSQGLSELADIEKSFKAFNTVIASSTILQRANAAATALTGGAMRALGISVNATSTSFKVLKAAIISTGIGALVVAVGMAVEALMNWTSATDETKSATDRLNSAIEQQNELLDANEAAAKRREKVTLARMRAQGASEEKIREQQLKNQYESYTRAFEAQEQAAKLYNEGLGKVDEETLKKLQKNLDDRQKAADDAYASYLETGYNFKADELKAEEDAAKNLEAKRKAAFEKQKGEREKQLEEEKKFNEQRLADRRKVEDDLLALMDEYRKKEEDARAKTEAQKIQLEKKRAVEEVIRAGGNAAQVNAVKRFYDGEAAKERDDFAQKSMQNLVAAGAASVQRVSTDEAAKVDIVKKAFQDQEAINQARIQSEQALVQSIGSAIGALGGLFEQGTVASKAAGLAEVAINTGVGFANALRIAQESAKATGPGAAFAFPIFYATQIAAVIKAVTQAKNILKTVKGGAGSGGSISGGGLSTGAPLQAAVPIGTQLQLQSQQAINQMGNQATRAYILNSDLQNNQQINAYLLRNASIG